MGLKCYICKCYDSKKQSLFRIPNRNEEHSDRWRLWLKILGEKEQNIQRIRICSEHFLKKKPAKKDDYLNCDWVPNQNMGNYSKNKNMHKYFLKNKNGNPSSSQEIRNQEIVTDDRQAGHQDTNVPILVDDLQIGHQETNVTIVDEDRHAGRNGNEIPENNQQAHNHIQNLSNSNLISLLPDNHTKNLSNSNLISLLPVKKRKIDFIKQTFFFPKNIQTELTSSDINMLFEHLRKSEEDRNKLLLQISTFKIDYEFFKGNDRKTLFYTGLTTWKLLDHFFKLIEPFLPEHGNSKLSPFQMLILTLMKLRLNLLFTDLGYRFQVDSTTASRYFHRCLYILFKKFHNSKVIYWPQHRAKLLLNTPSYFRCCFKELVTIIIDCFEIFIERSSVLRAAAQSWSQYKHHATIKFLIGISVSGAIIFISPGFGGRTSDKEITIKSGLLDKLEEGDLVLADKGFLIQEEVEAKNASLRMPCFVRNGNQLLPKQVEESRHLSSVRIHVERLISVLRQKFNICSDLAVMSAISKQNDLYNNDLYDKILYVCCCLVNLCPSVVRNDFEI